MRGIMKMGTTAGIGREKGAEKLKLAQALTRRGEHTKEATNRKIAQTTLQIALSEGVRAVTIEEVSRRSGVAKTTIYRRFSNSDELLKSISVLDIVPPIEVDELEATEANLELLISTAVTFFDESVGVKSVGMILSSDAEFFKQIFDHVIVPIKDRVSTFFLNGIAASVFRKDVDINFALEQVLGGMVVTAAVHGGVPTEWPRKMAEFLWSSIVR